MGNKPPFNYAKIKNVYSKIKKMAYIYCNYVKRV